MLIRATGVGHAFDAGPALFKGLTFDLHAGDLVGLSGPSGSGKTTLLTILAGWTRPTLGALEVAPKLRITWVPQHPVGVHQRSALDHVTQPLMWRGTARARAEHLAGDALEGFGLGHVQDQPMGHLSGGEAQRLMLARASLTGADLLLVDEPTAQLDPNSAREVIARLGRLADTGRAVVIASHDPRVLAVCHAQISLGPVA